MQNKYVFIVLFLIITQGCAVNAAEKDFFHFCKQFFENYAAGNTDETRPENVYRAEINEQLRRVEASGELQDDSIKQMAFWINVHNLIVIRELQQSQIKHTLTEQKGFWKQPVTTLFGEDLSLRDIQQNKLMDAYNDPRIMLALYLGVRSSPLHEVPYVSPDDIDDDLEAIAQKALNNDHFIRLKEKSEFVVLSPLLKWHYPDHSTEELIQWINTYRKVEDHIPLDYEVKYYPFSWKLLDE